MATSAVSNKRHFRYAGAEISGSEYTPEENYENPMTVGEHIFDTIGSAFTSFLQLGHLAVRVDLVRPQINRKREVTRSERSNVTNTHLKGAYLNSERQLVQRPVPSSSDSSKPKKWSQKLQKAGARLKIMQVWDFPDKETGQPTLPWGLNVGVGLNYEDTGLQPRLRLRSKHAALHILPRPELEMRARFNLISAVMMDVKLRIPLDKFEEMMDGEVSPRLTLHLHHRLGSGIHLSPGGLEFDERLWKIGNYTHLRAAAFLDFPRQIPFEGEEFKFKVTRLGLQTRLL